MDLQEQLEVGKQAEDFLRYTAEHPYFNGLLERMRVSIFQEIGMLDPSETEAFRTLKIRMDCIPLISDTITAEIFIGAEAFKKLTGVTEEPKGLL
jgi:hypothetical protein